MSHEQCSYQLISHCLQKTIPYQISPIARVSIRIGDNTFTSTKQISTKKAMENTTQFVQQPANLSPLAPLLSLLALLLLLFGAIIRRTISRQKTQNCKFIVFSFNISTYIKKIKYLLHAHHNVCFIFQQILLATPNQTSHHLIQKLSNPNSKFNPHPTTQCICDLK